MLDSQKSKKEAIDTGVKILALFKICHGLFYVPTSTWNRPVNIPSEEYVGGLGWHLNGEENSCHVKKHSIISHNMPDEGTQADRNRALHVYTGQVYQCFAHLNCLDGLA